MKKLIQFKFIFYQLTRPFSYLSISHEDKWIYDWFFPLVLSIIALSVFYFNIPLEQLSGENGLIKNLANFVSILPGFFIAALAAVATFNKNDIDLPIANPPKINILYAGRFLMVDMTRRRFLCVLFSYLTAVSIFLAIGAYIGLAINVSTEYYKVGSWLAISIFTFFFCQMILATFLGLYYLGERLHSPQ